MLMAHQSKEILQYTNQYHSGKIRLKQAILPANQALSVWKKLPEKKTGK